MGSGIQLAITGRRSADNHLQWWAMMWIRINDRTGVEVLDADMQIPAGSPCRLDVRCDDVVEATSKGAFSSDDAEQIIEFVLTNKVLTDRLLVSCAGGYGRSPAVALGILCALGVKPEQALKDMQAAAAHPEPNPLIVQVFDRTLGLNGRLWEVFESWATGGAWYRWRRRDLEVEGPEAFRARLGSRTRR